MAERQNDKILKSTRCVFLAQRQNDTVRHFGKEGHFRTATKRYGVSICRCTKVTLRAKVTHRVILSLCHSDTHPLQTGLLLSAIGCEICTLVRCTILRV